MVHDWEIRLRRALASRIMPKNIVESLGIRHVQGFLIVKDDQFLAFYNAVEDILEHLTVKRLTYNNNTIEDIKAFIEESSKPDARLHVLYVNANSGAEMSEYVRSIVPLLPTENSNVLVIGSMSPGNRMEDRDLCWSLFGFVLRSSQ